MTREEVFDLIREERGYQILKYGETRKLSVGDYITILKAEIDEAAHGFVKNRTGRDSAIMEILQVAAVAVAALEEHGDPPIIFDPPIK